MKKIAHLSFSFHIKFFECFNSPSGEITLNTSFEESSNNEDDNNQYKFLEGASINYIISLNNI